MKGGRHHASAGLSLIELMVALAIGTVLMLGLTQIFSASRSAYQLSEGLSRVQENARFALDFLQRDIRMAGHFGCISDQARRQQSDTLISHFTSGGVLDFGYSIRGYDNASPSGLSLSPARIDGTDSVALRFLGGSGIAVSALGTTDSGAPSVQVDAAKWSLLNQNGGASLALFGVADCTYADVFAAAGFDAGSGRVEAPAGVDFNKYRAGTSTLYRAQALLYYIGLGTGGRAALMRARISADGTAESEELVEGVENLQLRYGLDRNAATDPSGFVGSEADADAVGDSELDWRRVAQVRLALLMASPDPAASMQREAVSKLLGVTPTLPNDGRYRAVYETSVALRNRLYGN